MSSPLAIPAGDFAAYLFDCDGTLADSMPLHYEAWKSALAEWKVHFPQNLFYEWAGAKPIAVIQRLAAHHKLELELELGLGAGTGPAELPAAELPAAEIDRRREDAYHRLLPTVRGRADVLAHLEDARRRGLPCAVVSGSPRASVLKTLAVLGISGSFQAIVGAEDCAHGKPHPEPFLLAAQALGVDPARCLVFEDGELGIQSAVAAGLACVRVI